VVFLLVAICSSLALVPTSPAATVSFGFSDDAAMVAFPGSAPLAVSAGMSYARVFIPWSEIATQRPADARDPNDPAYDWSDLDRKLAPYAGTGLDVMAQIWMTPAWANGGLPPTRYPFDPNDFGDFAYAAALRYPQIHWWMPVNEPNLPDSAQPTSLFSYEAMLRAAYTNVKLADPGAQVVAGPLAHVLGNPDTDAWNWATKLAADHVPMDAFAVNPYPGWTAPISERSATRFDIWDLPALWRLVGVPVIVAEYGWTTELVTEQEQASWLGDAIRVARCTPGLLRFTLWGFHDHPGDPKAAVDGSDNWTHFGLLHADGTAKPALGAFEQALAAPLDCVAVGKAAGAPPGWTPLAQASTVAVATPGLSSLDGPLAGLSPGSLSGGGGGSLATSNVEKQLAPVGGVAMRARLIRLGRSKGIWWASVATDVAARVGARVDRLASRGAQLVRSVAKPRRAQTGIRRISLGRLRAGSRFRLRLAFQPARGSVVALMRVFRSPG
jgi:hypothetical protein